MAALALEQTKMPPTGLEMSAWTPKNNRTFNLRLFQERFELIKKWYSAWSENQRWQLIEHILLSLSDKDVLYLHSLIDPLFPSPPPPPPPPPPEIREDFTRKIPRFLSLKILSYLDPRSLCRTSQVSWHWHNLSQQNILWQPKCSGFGWFLPNRPANMSDPNTLWKRHYVNCVSSLFWKPPKASSKIENLAHTLSPIHETDISSKAKHCAETTDCIRYQSSDDYAHHSAVQLVQPLWKHPCRFPKDLTGSRLTNSATQTKFSSPCQKPKILKTSKSVSGKKQLAIPFNAALSDNECMAEYNRPINDEAEVMNGAVPIHLMLNPVLIEKMRLEEPSDDSVLISTANNSHTGAFLADKIEHLQEKSPFPKLKPYYVEASDNNSIQTNNGQEGHEESHETDSAQSSVDLEIKSTVKEVEKSLPECEDPDDGCLEIKTKNSCNEMIMQTACDVREWTNEDFKHDSSDSDIF